MDNKNLYSSDKFSEDVLDFIYKNGVSFLEQTQASNKVIANKIILLLSYLVIAIGFFINHLVDFLKVDIYDDVDVVIIIVFSFFAVYYFAITLWVIYIAKPNDLKIGYRRPGDLLSTEYLDLEKYPHKPDDHLHQMKYWCCLDIDLAIKFNLNAIEKRKIKFENAFACALVLPLIPRLIKKIIYFLNGS